MPEWLSAESVAQLKEALFRHERVFVVTLGEAPQTTALIGLKLREVSIPEGTLVAMIHREDEDIVPSGETVLHAGDRLTVIGRPGGVAEFRARYGVAARVKGD